MAALEIECTIKRALIPVQKRNRKAKVWFDRQPYAERKIVLEEFRAAEVG
jgi:hypothetical protein